MRWVSRVVALAVVVALIGGIALVVVRGITDRSAGERFETSAAFRDASKLPVGSRVMISGVHVGDIVELAVDGRLARVHMRLRDDVVVWDDAWAEKRQDSLFGDAYVEIHPGGDTPGARRLVSGEPIPRVIEGASTDRTLRDVDETLPVVEETLGDTEDFLAEARRVVTGPIADRLAAIDRAVADPDLARPIRDLDEGVTQLAAWADDTAAATAGAPARVNRALDDFAADVAGATVDLREGQADLRDALGTARARIDDVDPYLEDTAELLRRLDGEAPAEEQGTLGRLVNDPTLGDDLADTTESVRDFTRNLSGLETFVGLRAEYGLLNSDARVIVGAELSGRAENFYLFEVERTSAGDVPEVTLSDIPEDDRYVRTAIIRDDLRLTAQWGRRIGWFRVRFGLRESSFGVGADALLLGENLRLAADLSLPNFDRAPALKLAAALRVFEAIYISAGVDDALSARGVFDLAPTGDDVPQQFQELRYGRDPFVGVMLRFDDEDLSRLLLLYGAVIFAAL